MAHLAGSRWAVEMNIYQNEFLNYNCRSANPFGAPAVILGCPEMSTKVPLVAAHELGHILTGRGHRDEGTSIMHAQDGSISFWPGFELMGLGNKSASGFQQYQKSEIRTNTLQYGATGVDNFNGDY